MRLLFLFAALALLTACVPKTPLQQLPDDCRAQASQEQLLTQSWLQQDEIWRLRQSALLELGSKKVPLEGFLRLDLRQREARLVAMNEMGLVLFDLQVAEQEEQLHRAVPQLQRVEGFAEGVARSLRQIFLLPLPLPDDKLQNRGNSQRLWRRQPDGSLGFIYDCQADLRESRMVSAEENWRVGYDNYRDFSGERLPEQIVLNDYRYALKLTLWIHEMKREQP